MIRLKLKDLITTVQGGVYSKLADDPDYPIRTKFRLKSITKQVTEINQQYEESRIGLCQSNNGQLVPDPRSPGNTIYVFEEEDRVNFDNQIKELLDTEVELIADPLSLDDLIKPIGKPDLLSSNDYLALDWLIVEPAELAEPAPAAKSQSQGSST